MECIFCKIIAKELSSEIVYEDDYVVAFLDIRPAQKGHTLVLPRAHIVDFFEATPELLALTAQATQKIAQAAVAAVGADGFNLMVNTRPAAGQVIFHLHWHIIPRFEGDGLQHWPSQKYEAGEAEDIARNIRHNLGKSS